MARSPDSGDLVAMVRDLIKRVERLERSESVPPSYTAAERPTAADAIGLIILNTTTSKHQASDGTTWEDLY